MAAGAFGARPPRQWWPGARGRPRALCPGECPRAGARGAGWFRTRRRRRACPRTPCPRPWPCRWAARWRARPPLGARSSATRSWRSFNERASRSARVTTKVGKKETVASRASKSGFAHEHRPARRTLRPTANWISPFGTMTGQGCWPTAPSRSTVLTPPSIAVALCPRFLRR